MARVLSRIATRSVTALATLILCGCILIPGASAKNENALASLKERFADPPSRFRILQIIHQLPRTPTEQDQLMTQYSSRGFGGLVVNVGGRRNYLRDEKSWVSFTRGVNEAKKRGMAMWLYDERGYPSGTAGGLTMQGHPEWEASGLYVAEAMVTGAGQRPGPNFLAMPPGKLRLARAYPVSGGQILLDKSVDLSKNIKDGKLAWGPLKGEWRVMVFTEDRFSTGTHASLSLGEKRPYINLLLAEPTARFLQLTHQAYANHLGNDLGKYFIATFTDEPSLMSQPIQPLPYRLLPWSQTFAREFKKRRGYEIEPLVPALVAPAGPCGDRARYDFWLTVGELVSENYFGQIRDWCRKHNISSGGHLFIEEELLMHVSLYGDFFRCERALDAPSMDCLTSIPSEVPWHVARLVGSAGELNGRYDNMSETSDFEQRYRPKGDKRPAIKVTEDQIRGTCNRLLVNGINSITSYYQFDDMKDDQLRRLNLYIGRCCAMLHGGRQVTDVAVVYPAESVWTHFEPSHIWAENAPEQARKIDRIFKETYQHLFQNQRDFTFIDTSTLTEGKVDKGVFKYNGLAWRVIVLPCVDTLPLKAWQNLAKFWRSGGLVMALGALPANSQLEFPSPAVQAIAKEMFPEGERSREHQSAGGGVSVFLGEVNPMPAVLDALIEPPVKVSPAGSPLRVTHRRIEGQEIFFVINDSSDPWKGQLSLAAAGQGECYDPATGAITPLAGPEGLDLKLEAYGAALFRFDAPKLPQRRK